METITIVVLSVCIFSNSELPIQVAILLAGLVFRLLCGTIWNVMWHNLVCGRCWTAICLAEPHGNGRHFVNVGY